MIRIAKAEVAQRRYISRYRERNDVLYRGEIALPLRKQFVSSFLQPQTCQIRPPESTAKELSMRNSNSTGEMGGPTVTTLAVIRDSTAATIRSRSYVGLNETLRCAGSESRGLPDRVWRAAATAAGQG